MAHDVMKNMSMVSASPYHVITKTEVYLDPKPESSEVYSSGKTKVGTKWRDVYSPTKIGIEKLLNAAGAEIVSAETEALEKDVWQGKVALSYTRPDGKTAVIRKSKTIDLRVGGSRWRQETTKNLDYELADAGKSLKMRQEDGERWESYLIRVKLYLEQNDPERLKVMEAVAKEKATRFVTQAAQFGAELAETGAVDRAGRTLFNLRSYTEQELKEPFIIYSTKIDHAAMQRDFSKKVRDNLLLAQIGKTLGIQPEIIAQLTSGEEEEEEEEFEVIEIADPFIEDATTDTLNRLEEAFEEVGKSPENGSMFIFGKPLANLSEGQCLILLGYIKRVKEALNEKDAEQTIKALGNTAKDLAERQQLWNQNEQLVFQT